MTTAVIIVLSVLVLIAYVFDISSKHTRIPSVILLLALGWGAARGADFFELKLPDMSEALPILGTIGLILIVLEGSIELELNRGKLRMIGKSLGTAFFPLVLLSLAIAYVLHSLYDYDFVRCLANVLPLCVISSAIAIPTARNLRRQDREFIVFESSMSDILGVLLFNLIATEGGLSGASALHFLLELLAIFAISFAATGLLSFLLSRIDHSVKFTPIIFSLILIYCIAKIYHLPALLFILIFGLFLGNLDEIGHLRYLQWLRPQVLDREVHKFKEIVAEGTFVIRVLFFLLFGYMMKTEEILNPDSIAWALGITGGILLLRALQLKLAGLKLMPLLFIAPRGLITVLLFLSVPASLAIPEISKSLVAQVIVLTALVMMLGMLLAGNGKEIEVEEAAAGEDEPKPEVVVEKG